MYFWRISEFGGLTGGGLTGGGLTRVDLYCNIVLEKGQLPDIRAICRHYRWTLLQDGATAQTARTTMDYLKKRGHQLH